MPFEKGKSGNPKGRAKGVGNKNTEKVREAISRFADDTVEDFTKWIKDIAVDDKKSAAELFLKAIEYHIPKLARTEHTGQDGKDIQITIEKIIKSADN